MGNKNDTTRLGLTTAAFSAIGLAAALSWLRHAAATVGARVLTVLGLLLPGAICFTTVGRLWYLPGTLLVTAALIGAANLRQDAAEVRKTISHNWLLGLTAVLAGLYVFLGATAVGLAGLLGILGGLLLGILILFAARLPGWSTPVALLVVLLPFAVLTWWSVLTPLIAMLAIGIGWPALTGARHQHG